MIKEYIIVRSDLKMGKGKIAGQAGHASELLSYLILNQFLPKHAITENGFVSYYYLKPNTPNNDPEIDETYHKKGLELLIKWHDNINIYRKIVCKMDSEEEVFSLASEARQNHYPAVVIHDEGLTQIPQKTLTCCAFLVDTDDKNEFIEKLKTLSLL